MKMGKGMRNKAMARAMKVGGSVYGTSSKRSKKPSVGNIAAKSIGKVDLSPKRGGSKRVF